MKLDPTQRVLCICRNGQVRSVAARHVLIGLGFRKVICAGWEMNDWETIESLCDWADVVVVVGRPEDWGLDTPVTKTLHVTVGFDIWGHYDHAGLQAMLLTKLRGLM